MPILDILLKPGYYFDYVNLFLEASNRTNGVIICMNSEKNILPGKEDDEFNAPIL